MSDRNSNRSNTQNNSNIDDIRNLRTELSRQVQLANYAAQRAEIARQITEKQAQLDMNASSSIDNSSSTVSEMLDFNYMVSCLSCSLLFISTVTCAFIMFLFIKNVFEKKTSASASS